MDKILSIVIPAYNVERYLKRCLSSIAFIKPDLLEKIEVLVIDDGSNDNTSDIALKYCGKYPGIFYLHSKENGGHGSAINMGILHATGKYFKIVDGDDWLSSKALQKFIEILESQDVDIVASDYLCIKDKTGEILARKTCTDDKTQYGKISYMSKGDIRKVIKMHSLTIKTAYLKNMPYKIDEHCFYVDVEYITYPVLNVESVYYTDICLYMYRLGRNGQSVDIKSMQKNRSQHMKVYHSLTTFYKMAVKKGVEPNTREYIEKCIAQVMENQFQIYISLGLQKGIKKELQEWDFKLKKKYPRIYKSTEKKSIALLRITNYYLLKPAAIIYKLVKH